MNSTKIFARTDGFALLRNGKVPQIGQCDELGKRYLPDGTCTMTKCVEFNFYENGNRDKFFFEDDELIYYSISVVRKGWLESLLIDSVNMEFLTYDNFITTVLEGYVLHEMGFTADGQ